MTRRCYLHVGSPKTGTTYLQGVLWGSREELARQGLSLPLRRPDHFRLTVNLRDGIDPDVDPPSVSSVVDRMVEAIVRAPGDVLISNESLAVATEANIADLHERLAAVPGGLEVHVVVTARDRQRQLPAEWQQFVKTRHKGTFPAFLDAARESHETGSHRFWRGQNYPRIAARWSLGLPADHVHVVTVPPAGSAPELLLDRFCGLLGIDPARLTPEAPRTNPSLGLEQAELMRRINVALGERLPKPRVGYNKVAKFWFAEKVLAPLPGTRLALPPDRHAWWHEASSAMVRELREAAYDVVGDLDDLLPDPLTTPSGTPAAEVEDGPLLDLAVEGLAAALTQRDQDLQEIRSLRQELRGRPLREPPDPAPAPPAPPAPPSPPPVLGRRRARLLRRALDALRLRRQRARRPAREPRPRLAGSPPTP